MGCNFGGVGWVGIGFFGFRFLNASCFGRGFLQWFAVVGWVLAAATFCSVGSYAISIISIF